MGQPLAYFITWTTYGSWLPGDRRGWVKKGESGIQAQDSKRKAVAQGRMRGKPVTLSASQRRIVEEMIHRHCDLRNWTLHALNVRSNHVHMVVSAERSPETVMEQIKAWCSRRLNESDALQGDPANRRKWWTEHGSTKWINDERYLENAIRYVLEGQDGCWEPS